MAHAVSRKPHPHTRIVQLERLVAHYQERAHQAEAELAQTRQALQIFDSDMSSVDVMRHRLGAALKARLNHD